MVQADKNEDFSGYRILVADDNEIALEIVADTVREFGAECETATNGREALNKLIAAKRGYYSLVLTDFFMPEMDGIELVTAFRASAHPDSGTLPFIGMSADNNPELFDNAAGAGMNGMTNKPVSKRALAAYFTLVIKEGSANAAFAARMRTRLNELGREDRVHKEEVRVHAGAKEKISFLRLNGLRLVALVFILASILLTGLLYVRCSGMRMLHDDIDKGLRLRRDFSMAAEQLSVRGANLTVYARKYVSTGDASFMKKYFEEAGNGRVMNLKDRFAGVTGAEKFVENLALSISNSASLAAIEHRSMRLAAASYGVGEDMLPPEIAGVELSAEEQSMGVDDQRRQALVMLSDESYSQLKTMVWRTAYSSLESLQLAQDGKIGSVMDAFEDSCHLLKCCAIADFAVLLVLLLLSLGFGSIHMPAREREMIEAIKRERDSAIQAERAKTYFFATVSHDIRTPLNAIIGFSELLKFGNVVGSERDRYLSAIIASGNQLMSLVNDVLDLSKLDADKMTFAPAPSNVTKIADDIGLAFLPQAQQNGIELEIDSHGVDDGRLPVVDPARFKQILMNLVSNAVKFTKKGGVYVTVSTEPDAGKLTIRVRDTGPGISPQNIKKLAEPFVQLSTTDRTKGTGLGLAITRRLSEKMGGKLQVESEVGTGSTFSVEFSKLKFVEPPAAKPAEATAAKKNAEVAKNAASAVPQRSPEEQARRAALNVLLVDDQPLNLMVLSRLLRHIGVSNSKTVNSGAAAIEELKKGTYNLVLTDLWMPEMSGEELVNYIRASNELSSLPVYAVTADAEVVKHHAECGFNGYLLKPVTIDALDHLVISLA